MLDDLHFLIFQNKTRHSPSYVTDKNRIKNSLVLFYHKNKGKVISLPPQCPCYFSFRLFSHTLLLTKHCGVVDVLSIARFPRGGR